MGGCGDPRCPEGLSIKHAMDKALKDQDISTYLKVKEMSNPEAVMLMEQDGFAALRLKDAVTGGRVLVHVPLTRPDLVEQVQAVDKTVIPSFDSVEDIEAYAYATYPEGLRYQLYEDTLNGYTSVTVDIKVDADLRSYGIGRHLRSILMKHADENGKFLSGVPTNVGDGTIPENSDRAEAKHANALSHRNRLVKFYLDTGYEYNYCYRSALSVDWLTKERFPTNSEWEAKFNEPARQFLSQTGFYVRWPNNTIPAKMLAK